MEMSVPYRIRPEIQEESDIRTVKGRYRTDTAKTVRREEGGDNRSGSMCGSHSHARQHTAAPKCITVYGISQGEKYVNDIRPSFKSQIQIWKPTLLVPWLLCRHGRKEQEGNREYIRNQLVEDEMMDQMTMKEYIDPFTGSKNK